VVAAGAETGAARLPAAEGWSAFAVGALGCFGSAAELPGAPSAPSPLSLASRSFMKGWVAAVSSVGGSLYFLSAYARFLQTWQLVSFLDAAETIHLLWGIWVTQGVNYVTITSSTLHGCCLESTENFIMRKL
jgi:hypothetical protein